MNDQHDNSSRSSGGWFAGQRGIVVVSLIAIVAFVFGAWLFGGNGEHEAATGGAHQHEAEAAPAEATVWTCSMHPQIKLPEEGQCPICFMDLIPLEAGESDLGPRQLRMSATAQQLARIRTTEVRRAFAATTVRMTGRITYDETRQSYITAWVPGRLDSLFVDYAGMTVNKGDHMVSLYSPDLLAAQEELVQAKRAVKALEETTSRMLAQTTRETLNAVREKLSLYGLTDAQVRQIEETGTTSNILTVYAPTGGVVVEKLAREGEYVATGTRLYTIADLSRLWVVFEAYETDLPWLRFGQQIEFTTPSLPGQAFDAVISFIAPIVDPKTRTVEVRAVVDNPKQLLKPDMFTTGYVESQLNAEGDVVDEYLADRWISPMHPWVVKAGPGQCDVCGMDLVPARELGYAGKAPDLSAAPLIIPATAPLVTGERAVVYVEIADDADGAVFEGREIRLGPRAGDTYVVRAGLKEGEEVVTNGAFKIDAEMQIQARPSMMTPPDEAPSAEPMSEEPIVKQVSAFEEPTSQTAPAAVRNALGPVYDAYFQVQMALANDDFPTAQQAADKLVAAIDGVDSDSFSRSQFRDYNRLTKPMQQATEAVAEADGIAVARDGFLRLSEAIIALHDRFGHSGEQPYYLTFCPMAFDNSGAFWLQTENIVWNSFYGDMMLRCGEIREELPANE